MNTRDEVLSYGRLGQAVPTVMAFFRMLCIEWVQRSDEGSIQRQQRNRTRTAALGCREERHQLGKLTSAVLRTLSNTLKTWHFGCHKRLAFRRQD